MFKVLESSNLSGEIKVWWSKNAALPIIAANHMLWNRIHLKNKPAIKDVETLEKISQQSLKNSLNYFDLSTKLANKIRASILLIPVGLKKYGEVKFSNPWGCKIWKRSLNSFDDAFKQAWVEIKIWRNKIYKTKNKPNKHIILKEFSVTTTESLISYLAFLSNIDYKIRVDQISIEPHVINLINFLKTAGANIKLEHNNSVIIKPTRPKFKKDSFRITWDYIQAGTYFALWACANNSEIIIKWCDYNDLIPVLAEANKIGVNYEILSKEKIKVNSYNKKNYKATTIQTWIHPWFPTDLQSIFGVLLTQAKGLSKIQETLFEGRFAYLAELEKIWANIEILNPNQAIIIWQTKLKNWYISTTDLRWGGAMIIAWIISKGTTYITNEEIILRWYENIIKNLQKIWVKIEKI